MATTASMVDSIYIKSGDSFVSMVGRSYDSEKLLQELLADHPELLAGDQMGGAEPRRWLLVSREISVPSEEGVSGRWSVDHLFLDQDGVPTLVEVKRSSDTRIRREVIGQMLDYAANAVVYWPVERVRENFTAQLPEDGPTEEEAILELLGKDEDIEEFWKKVKTNLQAGRIRMLFIADAIPDELRRIVEFLNGQMDPAEILAVEVRQYVGNDMQVLVPRVIGQTSEAQRKKSGGSRRSPEPNPLLQEIARRWNTEDDQLRANENSKAPGFLQLSVGHREIHYEWIIRPGENRLGIALHLESGDRTVNFSRLDRLKALVANAAKEAELEYETRPFGRKWAAAEIYLPLVGEPALAERAVKAMKMLVSHTRAEVQAIKENR